MATLGNRALKAAAVFRFVADSARLAALRQPWLTIFWSRSHAANQQDNPTDRIQGHHAAGRRRHPALPAPEALAGKPARLFGDDEFFDGDAALLDLSQLVDVPEPDWRRLRQVFKVHGLNVIGVRGGSEELRYGAAFAGLPTYAAGERNPLSTASHEAPALPSLRPV
jgi:hypothetical protein